MAMAKENLFPIEVWINKERMEQLIRLSIAEDMKIEKVVSNLIKVAFEAGIESGKIADDKGVK